MPSTRLDEKPGVVVLRMLKGSLRRIKILSRWRFGRSVPRTDFQAQARRSHVFIVRIGIPFASRAHPPISHL